MPLDRLNRYLAQCGLGSRRAVDELISRGRVQVNGDVATLGTRIDASRDQITVDERAVSPVRETHVTVMLNKPTDVVTTVRDPHKRKTVFDFVDRLPGMVPVGRLDMDSRGLLLLSSDGELVHRMTHPRYGVVKRYRVRIEGGSGVSALGTLEREVMLDDGPAHPLRVSKTAEASVFDIEMVEGRKREVRRICAASGFDVIDLKRTAYGPLKLGSLPEGAWRSLSAKELQDLYACVELSPTKE
jgi:23S rRNA pseudouridine2605 synthase